MKINCKRIISTIQKYILAYLITAIPYSNAQVKTNSNIKHKSKNLNFSLKSLEIFNPGNVKVEIDMKIKDGQIYEKKNNSLIIKYNIKHHRFKFSIFVQYHLGKVVDYWVNLPTYFLHDTFLQSLINNYGKQSKYFHKDNLSLYFWKNSKDQQILYSGSCTITCFPVYLYVRKANRKKINGLKYLITRFQN